MKLYIEEWSENHLCGDGSELIKDAILCYKTGEYRAAFLMSYLAFKTSIREKITTAQKPDTISEKCWLEQIITPLEDDDKWEEKMNELIEKACANGNGVAAVFKFSNYERVKNRYIFWKNIRNSCVHAKSEIISSSTVEHFWEFIINDLSEYYVTGATSYINKRLVDAYLYYYTLGDGEIVSILNEIALVFKKNAKKSFDNLFNKCPYCLKLNERDVLFWKNVINCENDVIIDAFIVFFMDHINYFTIWYEKFPKIFLLINERDKTFVQRVLSPWLEGSMYFSGKIIWKLLVQILQIDNKLIDINMVTGDYQKFTQLSEVKELNEFEKYILSNNNIFNSFLLNAGKEYFSNTSEAHFQYYMWGSGKNDQYPEKCFEMINWNLELIDKINGSCIELTNSMKQRTNSYAIQNGEAREKSYQRVLKLYKSNIISILDKNKKNIEEYEGIKKLIED